MSRTLGAKEAFKTALSIALLYWLALSMNWDMPGYGALAIILISMGSMGASFNRGVLRLLGTTVGVLMGFYIVGNFAQDSLATVIFVSCWLVIVAYMRQISQAGYAWFVAGFVPLILWSTSYAQPQLDEAAFRYGSFRYLETAAGIVIYTIVSVFLWPIRSVKTLRESTLVGIRRYQDLFRNFRRRLEGGEIDLSATADRYALVSESLAATVESLKSAYGDSSRVKDRMKDWEVFRVNLRGVVDALNAWGACVEDSDPQLLRRSFSNLEEAMDRFEKRMERFAELAENGKESADHDAEALREIELKETEGAQNSRVFRERIAFHGFEEYWRRLDQISREVFRGARRILRLDPRSASAPVMMAKDQEKLLVWNATYFRRALYPMLCYNVCFWFWIYCDPPGGPAIAAVSAVLSLNFLVLPIEPRDVLIVEMGSLWVCLAPVYFLIMPALSTGFELLLVIFCFVFFTSYVGRGNRIFRLVPVTLLARVAGINEQQTYSFTVFSHAAMLITFAVAGLALVKVLIKPIRSESAFSGILRGFFRDCGAVVRKIAKGRDYYESPLDAAPPRLKAVPCKLKDGEAETSEALAKLTGNMHGMILRLKAVDAARRELVKKGGDLKGKLAESLREIEGIIGNKVRALSNLEFDVDKDEDQRLARVLERLERESGEKEEASIALHALAGGVIGCASAAAGCRRAMSAFDFAAMDRPKF